MAHWATQYIGKKWVPCGRGPDEFDCWGLVWWVNRMHLGIELPEYPNIDPALHLTVAQKINEGAAQPEWTQEATPLDGYTVALSRNRIYHHVGIYAGVDGGLVIHAYDSQFVVAQSVQSLQRNGWRKIHFFKHKDFKWSQSSKS